MLVAEIQELEEVKTLVTRGQQLGVLTFGDVATAVSEVELDESDVEDLYGHLEKVGIELVEDLDPAQKAAAENERSDGKRGGRKKKALDLKLHRINAQLGHNAGFINPKLYAAGVLRDITQGDNGAYKAGAGWDACTGLGSPDGAKVLTALS